MGYVVNIDPDTAEGRALEEIVRGKGITPEEAVGSLLRGEIVPGPRSGPREPFWLDDKDEAIGIFADVPGYREAMDRVVRERESRYSGDR